MGEIDTKPINAVEVAETMFEDRGDQRKHKSIASSSSEEMEKEKDSEGLVKELANYKVQMEAKDAAYLQLVHELEKQKSSGEELSTLLNSSEIEKSAYVEQIRESRSRIDELESKMKEMADQVLENEKIREQLSVVLSELNARQGRLRSAQKELAAAKEDKGKALILAETMEIAVEMEKERAKELSDKVRELKVSFARSKKAAIEAKKEKSRITSERDSEIELATRATAEAQEVLEHLQKQMKVMPELENQLLAISVLNDSLQTELNQANDQLSLSEKSRADAIDNLSRVKAELESKVKENYDQAVYIAALETAASQSKQGLKDMDKEVTRMKRSLETLTEELEMMRRETAKTKERKNEQQNEIATSNSVIHEAEAECSTKKESSENITISINEYNSLLEKFKKAIQLPTQNYNHELDTLKQQLRAATAKTCKFRTRAEQAATRAEAAEKANMELEDQLKGIKAHKQRRKAALAALRKECYSSNEIISTPAPAPADDSPSSSYQPLGKVLNIKF